ncbi:MAG: DUF1820 family protein [Pseudomonadota bacterium]
MSKLYRISFASQGRVYEVFAESVVQSDLFGFLEISELKFGARSAVVVDPSEERIKSEFEGVKRTLIPMHNVIRIDEVEKQGVSKVSKMDGSNVTPFPASVYPQGSND